MRALEEREIKERCEVPILSLSLSVLVLDAESPDRLRTCVGTCPFPAQSTAQATLPKKRGRGQKIGLEIVSGVICGVLVPKGIRC